MATPPVPPAVVTPQGSDKDKKRKAVAFALPETSKEEEQPSKKLASEGARTLADNEADANTAITLKLELDSSASSFHPAYTNQQFGDLQIIKGYKNLAIDYFLNGSNLFSYFNISYTSKQPDADDIEHILLKEHILPPETRDLSQFRQALVDVDPKFCPPGEQISSYTSPRQPNVTYEIYTGVFEDPTVKAMHDKLQVFTVWFIDGSNYIDVTDHRWRVFYLFGKDSTVPANPYRFMGLITSYWYWSYHRTVSDKVRMRVSQVMILPPYQRQGHGARLYNAVWRYALQHPRVADISVEDPIIDFSRLRDVCDVRNCLTACMKGVRPSLILFPSEVQRQTKLSKPQIRRVYELLLLRESPMGSEEYKTFRLLVKARLLRQDNLFKKEDLALTDEQTASRAAETKQRIEAQFRQLEAEYQHVLARLRHEEANGQ